MARPTGCEGGWPRGPRGPHEGGASFGLDFNPWVW